MLSSAIFANEEKSTNMTAPVAQAQQLDPNMEIKKPDSSGLIWYNPWDQPIILSGFAWFEANNRAYNRLPVNSSLNISNPVKLLALNTSGGQIRFQTDSCKISIRASLPNLSKMDHMTLTGQNGFDLYMGPPGDLRFLGVSRINSENIEAPLFAHDKKEMRNFVINFPLYTAVNKVEIGVEDGAKFEAPAAFADSQRIVIYGTSITQGGCASRPGMSYTNILSRRLNREIINLGFSGNGTGEIALAAAINDIKDKSLVILDYDANVTPEQLTQTLEPFIQKLREADPKIPIIVVSKVPRTLEITLQSYAEARQNKLRFQRELVEKLRAAGDTNIYFLDGSHFLGSDWDACLVDGIHLTDLGSSRMAENFSKEIQRIMHW